MKKLSLLITAIFFTLLTNAQDAATAGYLEAYYETSTGMISYRKFGEITKDGIKLIELKTTALNKFVTSQPAVLEMEAVDKERTGLEALRQRIILQRERMAQ